MGRTTWQLIVRSLGRAGQGGDHQDHSADGDQLRARPGDRAGRGAGTVVAERAPHHVARVYISVIRGTPLLVQLFIVFYGLPEIGIKIDPYVAAIIAFSLNVGGYAAEIIRASILACRRGSARRPRRSAWTTRRPCGGSSCRRPARIAVPPLSNTLLSLVKDTSLASTSWCRSSCGKPRSRRRRRSSSSRSTARRAVLLGDLPCAVVRPGPLERRLGRYVAR